MMTGLSQLLGTPAGIPVAQEQAVTSTFSGLLEVLGQQGSDVGSVVAAGIQPWQGFQGPGRWSAGVPLVLCQALLQLGRHRIPIERAPALLAQGAHREHGKEHADAQPAVHCWGEKGQWAFTRPDLPHFVQFLTPESIGNAGF